MLLTVTLHVNFNLKIWKCSSCHICTEQKSIGNYIFPVFSRVSKCQQPLYCFSTGKQFLTTGCKPFDPASFQQASIKNSRNLNGKMTKNKKWGKWIIQLNIIHKFFLIMFLYVKIQPVIFFTILYCFKLIIELRRKVVNFKITYVTL